MIRYGEILSVFEYIGAIKITWKRYYNLKYKYTLSVEIFLQNRSCVKIMYFSDWCEGSLDLLNVCLKNEENVHWNYI